MSMNARVRELREYLGLTMKEFGEKLSLSQGNVSLIENGKVNVTERNIKLICATWDVNEKWLRTGTGKMLHTRDTSNIEALVAKFSFPEICAKLLYAYDGLDEARQEAVLTYARSFIASMLQDDPASVADAIAAPSQEDTASRQALAQRTREETSPASQPGNEIA